MTREPRLIFHLRLLAFWLALTFTLALMTVQLAQAQTFTVLHAFSGFNDGGSPFAGLTKDAAGNFYGTTFGGGVSNCGTVFRLTRSGSGWILVPIHSFACPPSGSGAYPLSRVTLGPDGALYGATELGGESDNGVAFRIAPQPTACRNVTCPWTETTLYEFLGGSDGSNGSWGDVVFDAAGNLYGTTIGGGGGLCVNGCGTVYELSPSNGFWMENILYFFGQGTCCHWPTAGVIFDTSENLYGTGSESAGGIYEFDPSVGWMDGNHTVQLQWSTRK